MTSESPLALAERRVRESLAVQEALLEPPLLQAVVDAAAAVSAALTRGGTLLAFGNGGSAADATHIAAELVGRFLEERRALAAVSLSDNASAVTAIANDYGYEYVFARQIEALGQAGDVALGLSTSGRSANVVAGLEAARAAGLTTIALTGGDGGPVGACADLSIVAPSEATPRIQECHTTIAHVLCELIEQDL